jgi:two-component system, OmpR family, sensor kinase
VIRRTLGGLGFRLFASYALVILLTLVLAAIVLSVLIGGYREQVAAATLREIAPSYYSNVLRAAVEGGNPAVRAYIEEQVEESNILALVLDSEGVAVQGSSGTGHLLGDQFEVPSEAQPMRRPSAETVRSSVALLDQQAELTHETGDGEDFIYLVAPLPVSQLSPEQTSLVIGIPEDAPRGIIGELTPYLLRAGLVGLVVALVIAALVSRSLLSPLRRVIRGSKQVAAGDYNVSVPVSGATEVRELASSFNSMTAAVRGSQQTTKEFLANISHELKTPLTSIRGYSQALVDGTLTDEQGRARAARVIDGESRRVLYLVEELLDLSRLESGQVDMRFEQVDLGELFARVKEIFALRAQESGVELQVVLPAVPPVRGDFDRLEQVIGNLLDNAFRHTREGNVKLAAELRGSMVEISVEDSGEGIPAGDLDKVFERFYQADARSGQGTGLGLAISREIVRAHGGNIRAEALPDGTRISLRVPVGAADGVGSAAKAKT